VNSQAATATMSPVVSMDSVRLARDASSDPRAARRVVEKVLPRIRHRIALLVPFDAEAADLENQCLLEVFRSLGRYRGEASLATWADRITYRVAMRALKRRRRRERTVLLAASERIESHSLGAGALPAPDEQTAHHAMMGRLQEHLGLLHETQRTAVVLKVFLGHSMKEVAAIMGAPLETTRSRVKTGLSDLRRRVERDHPLMELLGRQTDSARTP